VNCNDDLIFSFSDSLIGAEKEAMNEEDEEFPVELDLVSGGLAKVVGRGAAATEGGGNNSSSSWRDTI
jgi:hypothetical protein